MKLQMIANYLWLIPLFPALGFIVNGLWGRKFSHRVVSGIACGAVLLSFLVSVLAFFGLTTLPPEERVLSCVCFSWIHVGHLSLDISFVVDPLTAVMLFVVTGVGLLIHIYSIGYMGHDHGFARFFTYMNLFMFMMLTLVMAENILLLFVGWEGVGLCSYLLIGYWYEEHPNNDAAKKAFVVNRIGDFGFLLGIFTLFWAMGAVSEGKVWTLSFSTLSQHIALLQSTTMGQIFPIGFAWLAEMRVVNFIAFCLFIGATGKSAQIPLYVWLPDAMAGPTPVSALIHAATMVTAGVYMIARLHFLYALAPAVLTIIALIAGFTAFMAATIALTQYDIKKVLAYSTVSQLGYMFLAMGAAAFSAGVFHLMTHAFFKACLFLGAGSVIHAMGGKQDMREMGGLKKKLDVTHWTMLASTVAIAGIPFTAGFFSKDEILWKIFESHHQARWHFLPWVLGLAAAFLTAFYMFRLIVMTFYGECRSDEHTKHHLHESPKVMLWPLRILGTLALVAGFVGVPYALGKYIHLPNFFENWLSPVFHKGAAAHAHPPVESVEYGLMLVSVAIAVIASLASVYIYSRRQNIARFAVEKFSALHKLLYNKYFVDELYEAIFVKGVKRLSQFFSKFDFHIIDGIVNGVAKSLVYLTFWSGKADHHGVDGLVRAIADATLSVGSFTKLLQSGRVQYYLMIAMGIFVSIVLLYQWI